MAGAKVKLVDKVLEGDILAAARLMRVIEDEAPGAAEALKDIYLHTGQAHVVGLTGAPGAGKSTLIDGLISAFRAKNMKVGVVAIDPSSHLTGGAILGDRIRMQSYGIDKDVFIRSLASRGWRGGLSKATANTVHVMDAMGKDVILVETVGTGQGEVDISRVSDTTIIILTPEAGDEIQMMKAGILEVADIFVINKSDRAGAYDLKTGLEILLGMKSQLPDGWKPSVVLTAAISNKGVEELAEQIIKHKEFLKSSGELEKRRKAKARLELMMAIEGLMKNYVENNIDKGSLEKLVSDIVTRKTSPLAAAAQIINPSLEHLKSSSI